MACGGIQKTRFTSPRMVIFNIYRNLMGILLGRQEDLITLPKQVMGIEVNGNDSKFCKIDWF